MVLLTDSSRSNQPGSALTAAALYLVREGIAVVIMKVEMVSRVDEIEMIICGVLV